MGHMGSWLPQTRLGLQGYRAGRGEGLIEEVTKTSNRFYNCIK